MFRIPGRLRGRLRRELLEGGPPTAAFLRPVGPEMPSDAEVVQVVDLCMGVGEVLLSSGEPAGDTAETMTRLAAACGLPTVDVDITFNSIAMCCHRGMVAAPVNSMRIVNYRTTDLTRLASVTDLVEQVTSGRMTTEAATTALTRATAARHPYPRWVATVGWGGLAAAVALLLGGSVLIGLTAFVVTALIDRIGRLLNRSGVPSFFLQVTGGLVATVATVAVFATGVLPPGTQPSLVIAGCVTALLSGLSVMSATRDAISGYYVTAAGRSAEIALLSAGLLAGVILGLKLGLRFGVTLDPAEPVGADVAQFGLSTFAAATAAGMFALASYAPLRSLPAAALTGGMAWAVCGSLTLFAGSGAVTATGVAAVAVGLATGLTRRWGRVHSQVIVLSGIIPLLPGLTAYRGFYQLATQQVVDGLVTITLALAIGLALAAGVALGDFVARPGARARSRARARRT
ncbi:threonine/serine exporter ThrE family protein [Actinoplanes sp. M2I2]|uniref:threonine/serine ThrE exporter family protein n=1 Tax=Actinoplanes sp. M2I2 TaxID=1734444 RepID=UPI002020C0A5|nr:threonine/serine exporter family protein [Actinoplanes sp. M2I2]